MTAGAGAGVMAGAAAGTADRAAAGPAAGPAAGAVAGAKGEKGRPVPVLFVDDNPWFLRVACEILGEGEPAFEVHTASTGAEALAFLIRAGDAETRPRPRFVVLDFHLPDMNAPAVLRALDGHPDLRAIPVLVLSAADWSEDEAATKAAGARRFVVKPSRVGPLRDVMLEFWKECEGA